MVSIHPEHVSNIISGSKVFEYRKVAPGRRVSHLIFYCTAPVKSIVAVAEVVDVRTGSPTRIWDQTSYGSGISRHFYRSYFSGQRSATAFVLGSVHRVKPSIGLDELVGQKAPPQSLCYVDDVDVALIMARRESESSVPSSTLFVGGVHGVGKSTICRKVLDALGYKCLTASFLISEFGKRVESSKAVIDVSGNQAALISQWNIERKGHHRLALDGHFSLVDSEGRIAPVDVAVFQNIGPDKFVLIRGDCEEIAKRLKDRDGQKWSAAFVEDFQCVEEEHARHVSEKLNAPLVVFDDADSYPRLAKDVLS